MQDAATPTMKKQHPMSSQSLTQHPLKSPNLIKKGMYEWLFIDDIGIPNIPVTQGFTHPPKVVGTSANFLKT